MNFSFGSRGRDRDKPRCRFSSRWVGRGDTNRALEHSFLLSGLSIISKHRIGSPPSTNRPFVPTFPRAFPSRRNRTIEGWGSRSTVNARSRRHRFGNWISSGFPNSCRVPLSNGSDPTEPVHLDQFYFRPRNGGELSNELKKSQRGTKNTPPRKIFL